VRFERGAAPIDCGKESVGDLTSPDCDAGVGDDWVRRVGEMRMRIAPGNDLDVAGDGRVRVCADRIAGTAVRKPEAIKAASDIRLATRVKLFTLNSVKGGVGVGRRGDQGAYG
jgi:hypothetical protein